MRRILDEILWRTYHATNFQIGGPRDVRFILLNVAIKGIHEFTLDQLKPAVSDLKNQKFIKQKKNYEGSILVSLTEKGILRAINYKFRRLAHKKQKWDGKWRMVAFDIPREYEKGRKTLVYRLKTAGFYPLQESIFLYPYDCRGEIDIIVKLFKLEKYVRFGTLDYIDIEDRVKFKFGIK